MSDATEIDQQHKKLVGMFSELNEAVKGGEPREVIYRIIDDIISFTRTHFVSEEQFMVQTGYPEIEAHKNKHKQLLEEALHLREKLEHVGEEIFTDWFNHWPFSRVLAHIQYADKQVEEYIAQGATGQR